MNLRRNNIGSGPIRFGGTLAILLLLSFPHPAFGDNSLKLKVFKDCAAALAEAHALAGDERLEFIDYVKRVLNLEATAPPEESINSRFAAVLRKPMDPGAEPLYNSEVARTLDPREELEARQCAAQLLTDLLPESIVTLPDIIRLAGAATQPEELRRTLAESGRAIAAKWALLNNLSLPDNIAHQLVALIDEIPPQLAADTIMPYGVRVIGIIGQELEAAPIERRERIFAILQLRAGTDPEAANLVYSLLSSPNEALRLGAADLIGRLKAFDRRLFSALLQRCSDSSEQVRLGADQAIRRQLGTISDPLVIGDQSMFDRLIQVLPAAGTETRGAIAELLRQTAAQLSEENKKGLTELLGSKEPQLQIDALSILARTGPLSKAAFNSSTNLLFSKDAKSEKIALEIMAVQKERTKDSLSAISRFLKLNLAEPAVERRIGKIVLAADTVIKAGFGSQAAHLAPYFTDALSSLAAPSAAAGTEPAADEQRQNDIQILNRALVSIGPDAINDLRKLLGKSASATAAAAVVLRQMPKLSGAAVEDLINQLAGAEPAAFEAVYAAINDHAQDDIAAMRHGLRSSKTQTALNVALILLERKLLLDQIGPVLNKNLASIAAERFCRLTRDLLSVPQINSDEINKRGAECPAAQSAEEQPTAPAPPSEQSK